jgi:YVTN family beta-propeller protein
MKDKHPCINVFLGGSMSRRRSPESWCATGAVLRLWCLALLGVALSVTSGQAAPFAYVTNAGSDDVSVIDTASNTVTATIPVGTSPFGVAVTPNGAFVYVTHNLCRISDDVSVIDTTTNTVTATIPVGSCPEGVAVTPSRML